MDEGSIILVVLTMIATGSIVALAMIISHMLITVKAVQDITNSMNFWQRITNQTFKELNVNYTYLLKEGDDIYMWRYCFFTDCWECVSHVTEEYEYLHVIKMKEKYKMAHYPLRSYGSHILQVPLI